MEGSDVRIDYGDDGAGLNLAKMGKATQANWLKQTSALTADLVARLVFQAGISTAEQGNRCVRPGCRHGCGEELRTDAGAASTSSFWGPISPRGFLCPSALF